MLPREDRYLYNCNLWDSCKWHSLNLRRRKPKPLRTHGGYARRRMTIRPAGVESAAEYRHGLQPQLERGTSRYPLRSRGPGTPLHLRLPCELSLLAVTSLDHSAFNISSRSLLYARDIL
ncbi:hypothetical protein J6590_085668 [Homalodisca vitripennis]|nr:hypothetical protein J6590_085668 [Homalodisca vitripennis]